MSPIAAMINLTRSSLERRQEEGKGKILFSDLVSSGFPSLPQEVQCRTHRSSCNHGTRSRRAAHKANIASSSLSFFCWGSELVDVVEGAPVGVLGRVGSRSATFARSSRNLSNSGKKELGTILKEDELSQGWKGTGRNYSWNICEGLLVLSELVCCLRSFITPIR